MAEEQPISIGVIVCSTRKPRVCPQIASFVLGMMKSSPLARDSINYSMIDLLEWNLPMFDETVIPSHVTSPAGYDHEHTRRWSAEISKHQAFVFVTPQYNWGYPASVKNAIDYLYNEWVGKPGIIATYGGRGGGKAAAQLKEVLQGLKMLPVDTMPSFTYAGMEEAKKAFTGQQLDLVKWEGEKETVLKAFAELLVLLEKR